MCVLKWSDRPFAGTLQGGTNRRKKHTRSHKQMDITTYRLNQPRGQLRETGIFFCCIISDQISRLRETLNLSECADSSTNAKRL